MRRPSGSFFPPFAQYPLIPTWFRRAQSERRRKARSAQGSMSGAPMEDMAGALPGLRVAPTFLGHFGQAHESPMSAWGDVVDNCRDAKATRLDIDVRSVTGGRGTVLVVLTDNGSGMLEDDMAKGISGLGYTDKGLETGEHHRPCPKQYSPNP